MLQNGDILKKVILNALIWANLVISQTNYIEKWDSATAYNGGVIVKYGSDFYMANYRTQSDIPAEHDTVWSKVKIYENVYFPWKDTKIYEIGDLVKHDDQIYISRHNSKNHEPTPEAPYDAWVPISFSILEYFPEKPGPEGDTTLLGIDSDTNGVRDDVEWKIGFYIPDNPEQRAAVMQIACRMQKLLMDYSTQLNAGMEILSFDISLVQSAIECGVSSGALDRMSLSLLKSIIKNTPERRFAFREINTTMAGYFGGDYPDEPGCDQSFISNEIARQKKINE